MKSILITGGAGFIGSHTCIELLLKGYNVFLLDSFENSSRKSIDRIIKICQIKNKLIDFNKKLKIFEGDIKDKDFVEDVFNNIDKSYMKIDGIIHLAGLKSVSESIKYPLQYWDNNVSGTINLLKTMSKYECNNFVFSSSATVYSQTQNSKITEDSDVCPINPYGNTKLTLERFLKDIYMSPMNKIKFASLRYFNPIGAHSSGLLGESPIDIPNNIFPLITNTAIGIQKVLKIYGNDWPTKDGTPIRDYIHVMDLADAHVRALDYLTENEPLYINLNIGTGIGTSVLELVKTFELVNNVKVPYVFTERRKGDAGYVVADNSLSISKINISCRRTIEDMCRDGWKWKKLNPNGF
tara:strand:- start:266 stop:1324 length:1059 start_codon:yes stop_codon:yes gene_type:complete